MENLKENRNPFNISGYLGRKWYFILGIIIAIINCILQLALCISIFKEVFNLAKEQMSYSIFGILSSGNISTKEIYIYIILYTIGIVLSFINNKKRFTDLFACETTGYTLAGIVSTITIGTIFINVMSALGLILTFIMSLAGIMCIILPGKLSTQTDSENETKLNSIETKLAVSFWRRLGAYFVDSAIILSPLSMYVGKIFHREFYGMGIWSISFGFILFLLYFGIMNSKICKGQTLGKMAFGIKVIDNNGDYLSLGKSLFRAFILTLCLMLPGALFNLNTSAFRYMDILYPTIAIFFMMLITFDCAFLFNFKTRQTLHDLLCGSYVVTNKNATKLNDSKTSPTPIIFAVICGLLLGTMAYIPSRILLQTPQMQEFINIAQQVEKKFHVNVKIITIPTIPPQASSNNLSEIRIVIATNQLNNNILADKIGHYLLDLPEYKGKIDIVTVIFQKIINLGNNTRIDTKTYHIAK